jgi:hypothetical protein
MGSAAGVFSSAVAVWGKLVAGRLRLLRIFPPLDL